MALPSPRKRRSASRIFIALLLVAATGIGLYFKYFRHLGGSDDSAGIDPLPALERFDAKRPLLGTEFEIVVYAPGEAAATTALDAAFAHGTAISEACSGNQPGSDLAKLHAAPAGMPVPLSPILTAVLAHALETADITDGAFDPTLGTLTALWRQTRASGTLPSTEALATAREAAGWKHLEVSLSDNTATLRKPGMKIDLGDIAIGYATDEMFRTLEQHGITRVQIRATDIARVGDPPPGKEGWRVPLRMFNRSNQESILVANEAVATAGDLDQFVDIGGQRYAHLIDPATGLGLTRRAVAAIIAPTAIQSAPLATFACIAPETATQVFIGGEIRCRVITINGADLQDRRSPNFPNLQAF